MEIYLIGYRAADEVIKEIFENVKPHAMLSVVNLKQQATREIMQKVIEWKPALQHGGIYDRGFAGFIEDYFKK